MARYSTDGLLDSPSRQLINDLARDLQQIRLHHEDLKKVHEYRQQSCSDHHDELDRKHRAVYYAAIDEAYASYDDHRREAERVLQEHLRQVEEERRRREEEERKRREELERLERERREREEAERKRQEEERRLAEQRAREEEKRRKEAEEAERARIAAEQEKARKERERALEAERQRQAQQKAEEEEKARLESLGAGRRSAEDVEEHNRYLELHKTLKKLRKYIQDEGKKNAELKEQVGNYRRTIVKCVGQLREGQGTAANRQQVNEIKDILRNAKQIPIPADGRQFFIRLPPALSNLSDQDATVPAVFVYLLNILTKKVVAQLISEASINPKYAEPLGVVVAQIFSLEENCFHGQPYSDIFWAKYRVVCPALWGFYGSEKTDKGKAALGWWRTEPGGPFIPEREHVERMTGLGAGFAAVTLRNFGKTTRRNPFPNWHFWKCMHKILSVPPEELQDTHFNLLASMLRHSAERIVTFYGHLGLALLRLAIVEIPNRVTRNSNAIETLKVLRALYQTEKNIIL